MPRYDAPIRDMQFILQDLLQIQNYSNLPGFETGYLMYPQASSKLSPTALTLAQLYFSAVTATSEPVSAVVNA